jgi:hypothetical protein
VLSDGKLTIGRRVVFRALLLAEELRACRLVAFIASRNCRMVLRIEPWTNAAVIQLDVQRLIVIAVSTLRVPIGLQDHGLLYVAYRMRVTYMSFSL